MSTTLYVVKHYVESFVLGVFDSEKKAKEAIQAQSDDGETYDICEFELNNVKE